MMSAKTASPSPERRNSSIKKALLASLLFTITLIPLFFTSGCWDQIQIEQRSYVTGMAIDLLSSDELKPPQVVEPGLPEPRPEQHLITLEIPILKKIGAKSGGAGAGGGGGGGGGGGPIEIRLFETLSTTGVSITQCISEMRGRTNRPLFLGHLKVLIIGEEFARKKGLREVLDYFFRSPEVPREVAIFIAMEKAKEVFTITPPDDDLVSAYLFNLSNLEKTTTKAYFQRLEDLLNHLFENGHSLLGRVRSEKNEAVTGGMAVIKDWKLAGFLGEVAAFGASLLMNQVGREIVHVKDPEGNWVAIRLFGVKTKSKPLWDGATLRMSYEFISEGEIEEAEGTREILKSERFLKEIEKAVEENLKKAAAAGMRELQQDYETDAIGLGIRIKKYHPRIWKVVEPNWKVLFPRIQVEFQAENKIRRTGVAL